MTARPRPDREVRPGITAQDAQDAIAVSAALGGVPPERRASLREDLAARALEMAGWPQT